MVRYTYWIAQVIAIGGEAVAAGLYMQFWFPESPGVDLVARLLRACCCTSTPARCNNFGTVESWFALIKVAAIVLFIILGAASHASAWTARRWAFTI